MTWQVYWASMADFWAMGGYGLFVWGSFGVTAAVMAWEGLALRRRRAQALAEVRNWRLLNDADGAQGDPQ